MVMKLGGSKFVNYFLAQIEGSRSPKRDKNASFRSAFDFPELLINNWNTIQPVCLHWSDFGIFFATVLRQSDMLKKVEISV